MTWLSRIVFSLVAVPVALATNVTGTVRLANSRVSAVRKGRDYSGVVVWLRPGATAAARATHPAIVTMEQKDKRFVPHILAVAVGTTVRFPNLDPIFHSAFSNFSGQVFDFGLYPPGTSREVTFTRPGVVRIFCNIHPAMSAVIVVLESLWFAISDREGNFKIAGVPSGDYRLGIFHERATKETLEGLERRLRISGQEMTLPPILVSETGYLETPHKNKYGLDYPPVTDDSGRYPAGRK